MAKAPYYQGDNVDLAFEVREKGKPVKPMNASVSIVDRFNKPVVVGPAKTENNLVRYIVDSEYTKVPGSYVAMFTVLVMPRMKRTHIIKYRILPKAHVIGEKEDKDLMPINENSSDAEVSNQIGETTKALRQLGETLDDAAEKTMMLAEKMTKRRIGNG